MSPRFSAAFIVLCVVSLLLLHSVHFFLVPLVGDGVNNSLQCRILQDPFPLWGKKKNNNPELMIETLKNSLIARFYVLCLKKIHKNIVSFL